MSKYKVTLKFYDEHDQVVYLRLPPQAAWFMTTSRGTINEDVADALFEQARKANLPAGARPVFNLPTKG